MFFRHVHPSGCKVLCRLCPAAATAPGLATKNVGDESYNESFAESQLDQKVGNGTLGFFLWHFPRHFTFHSRNFHLLIFKSLIHCSFAWRCWSTTSGPAGRLLSSARWSTSSAASSAG